jgi:hypothetical protein
VIAWIIFAPHILAEIGNAFREGLRDDITRMDFFDYRMKCLDIEEKYGSPFSQPYPKGLSLSEMQERRERVDACANELYELRRHTRFK